MLAEVRRLHSPPKIGGVSRQTGRGGISWRRLESFGLEYKFVSLYIQKKLSYDQMFDQLFIAIKQYTKRQLTWWKRNKEIRWIANPLQAKKITKKFAAGDLFTLQT
jgi:tRNA A37 N6-isopentenylltransferase MiaA